MAAEPQPSSVPHERAHPLVLWAWSVLRDRGEADRRLVFERLSHRGGAEQTTEKQQQAERALLACMNDRGEQPSRRAYDAWRDAQPRPKSWPSSSMIRNAFSSWPAALAAVAGQAAPDVLTRRLNAAGSACDADEMLAALKEWAEHAERPLYQQPFLNWCKAKGTTDSGISLPRSPEPLRRLFGGWHAALAEAGLPAPSDPQQQLPDLTAADVLAAPTSSGPPWATDALLEWLGWLGGFAPSPATLSAEGYDVLVARFNTLAERTGSSKRAPRAGTINKRLHRWPEARWQAGLCSDRDAAARRQGHKFTRHELLDACAEGLERCGLAMQMREYDAWSDREAARLVAAGHERVAIPRAITLSKRLGGGSWSEAIAETLRCRPRLAGRLSA